LSYRVARIRPRNLGPPFFRRLPENSAFRLIVTYLDFIILVFPIEMSTDFEVRPGKISSWLAAPAPFDNNGGDPAGRPYLYQIPFKRHQNVGANLVFAQRLRANTRFAPTGKIYV